MSTPPKLNNGGGDGIKMPKEPLRMVAESFHHSGKVPELNQPVFNSSKMVGMMHESAFGGFYYDTDGEDMENSARRQEEHEVLFNAAILNEYLIQVCYCYYYYYCIFTIIVLL